MVLILLSYMCSVVCFAMEKWKSANLLKEEEEGITVEEDEVCEEVFRRTFVGKIWTNSPYNVRAFKQI